MTLLEHAMPSPYSPSFSQRVTFELPASRSLKGSEENIYNLYVNSKKLELVECLISLDELSKYIENWDGHDASKPNLAAIKNTRTLLTNIFNMSYDATLNWVSPHISADSEGNVVLEWWGTNKKKITFYIGSTPNLIEYIKSSNEKINEMEDGKIDKFTPASYIQFFGWLR
ncbi:MAG: hypothetical protein ACYCQI_16715 [Gammaproteobacteria bacterium]